MHIEFWIGWTTAIALWFITLKIVRRWITTALKHQTNLAKYAKDGTEF